MTDDEKIERYTKALRFALRGLQADERSDIVAEIGAHLEHRMSEGMLDVAIEGLGSPAVCARAFRDELTLQTAFNDGGPGRTFGALVTLATRRLIAAIGLFIASLFLLTSIGMGFSAIAKLFAPDAVGLWTHNSSNHIAFGILSASPNEAFSEHLGLWYFPFASLLAVGLYLFSHRIGLWFLKLMIGRKHPLG